MRTGIGSRFTLATSLLVLVATFTVGYTVYRGARDSLIDASIDRLAHTADLIELRFAASMEAASKDVRFLSTIPPVLGMVRAMTLAGLDPEMSIRDDEWSMLLADTFEPFLVSRPSYVRTRFIGVADGGRELVRVEKRGGNIVWVRGDSLARLGHLAWVQEAAALPRGSVYFSELTHAEQGPGAPAAGPPILHAATPIYSESGAIFGVLAVDLNFNDVTNALRSLVDSTKTLYLANVEGDLLLRRDSIGVTDTTRAGLRLIQELFPNMQPMVGSADRDLRVQNATLAEGVPGVAYFTRLPFDRGVAREDLILGVTEPHSTILASVHRIRNQSALITLLFCLGGVAVALTLSNYMVRPLRKITRAVSMFGHAGHQINLPVDRRDEIGVLARTYDAMARQIQEQIHELGDQERRQRTILETSAEGIIVTDAGGGVETFNPAAERILGYPAGEVIGRKASDFIRPYGEIERPRRAFTEREEWLLVRPGSEAAGRRNDGSVVPLSVSWSTFELDGDEKYTIFIRDITEQKAAAAAQARLLRELEQERASLQLLSETLEERVKLRTTDLVRINDALERRNRELRDFAHVASHDLQEPLRRLRSFADMLLSEQGDSLNEQARHYAQKMGDAAERMSMLISDLRSFTSVTTRGRPFEAVDLNQAAEEVISDLEIYIAETGGRVEVGELPVIDADKVQMRQLLQNLIFNGLKFHKPDAPPVVQVGAVIRHREDGTEPGQDVCLLMVKDNGIGFDEKYLDRIFTPFQRLHGREGYEGTGMGLAICRRIAEHHSGSITAKTAPGDGATFIVTLPVEQPKPVGAEEFAEEQSL